MNQILGFFKEYRFLSNFDEHPDAPIFIDGFSGTKISCTNVEAAFQASKTFDIEERYLIAHANTPGKAKKLGKAVTLRPDWEEVKISVMRDLLLQKFSYPRYKLLLKSTGDAYLEETNSWGDRFWGVDKIGMNHLGKLLMEIRELV